MTIAETVIDQFVNHRLPGVGDAGGSSDSSGVRGWARPGCRSSRCSPAWCGAVLRQDVIDAMLTEALPADWPLNRIDPVLRALAARGCGGTSMPDGPPAKVVINEYLDVSRGFFAGAEPGHGERCAGPAGSPAAAGGVLAHDRAERSVPGRVIDGIARLGRGLGRTRGFRPVHGDRLAHEGDAALDPSSATGSSRRAIG